MLELTIYYATNYMFRSNKSRAHTIKIDDVDIPLYIQ